MASPNRYTNSYWGQGNDNNIIRPLDPQQPVLAVTPLNSVPYTGPPPVNSNIGSLPTDIGPRPPLRNQPAMVFLPSHSTEEEWDKVIAATKNGVGVSGSAALGKVGPAVGAIDIGESMDSYLFRVSLPGVVRDEKVFSCNVEPNGKILIKGVTFTGDKKVVKNSMVFQMQTQNLCPQGEFSISFQLPGPVDNTKLTGIFGNDGIFEGVVMKAATE